MSYFHFTKDGLKEAKAKPELPIGTVVHAFGSGMCESRWAVCSETDEHKSQKIVRIGEDDGYFHNPFNRLNSYDKPISEKFGIGFYYDLDAEPFTKKEVDDACEEAERRLKRMAEEEAEKKRKDEEEKERLIKENPELIAYPKSYREERKNLVTFLKKTFPGVKFSVKKSNGSAMYVTYKNGPAKEKVDDVCNLFVNHSTDFTGDFRDYTPSNFNRVFGGFKYVFLTRDVDPEIEELTKEDDGRRIDYQAAEILNKTDIPENYGTALLVDEQTENGWWERKIVFENDEEPEETVVSEEKEVTEKVDSDVEVIDYSAKAIAVTGNTKPIKDVLKRIGGKFNPRLRCGAGWIFPKSKKELVLETVGL